MKFTLTIELGNETMQTFTDVKDALSASIQYFTSPGTDLATPGDGDILRDINGNTVGKWEVTA